MMGFQQDLRGTEGFAPIKSSQSIQQRILATYLSSDSMASTRQLLGRDFSAGPLLRGITDRFSDEPIIPAEQLNEKYKDSIDDGTIKRFDTDYTDSTARSFLSEARLKRAINKTLSKPVGTGQAVGEFFLGMVPFVLDPIDIGLGVMAGYGAASVAAKMASKGSVGAATYLARVTSKAGSFTKLTSNIAEGAVANVVGEIGFVGPGRDVSLIDYNLSEGIQNAVLGAMAFPIAMKGIGAGFRLAKWGGSDLFSRMFKDTEIKMSQGHANVDVRADLTTKLKSEVMPDLRDSAGKIDKIADDIAAGRGVSEDNKLFVENIHKKMKETELFDELSIVKDGKVDELSLREMSEKMKEAANEIEKMPEARVDDYDSKLDDPKEVDGRDPIAEQMNNIEEQAKDTKIEEIKVDEEYAKTKDRFIQDHKENLNEAEVKAIADVDAEFNRGTMIKEVWDFLENCVVKGGI